MEGNIFSLGVLESVLSGECARCGHRAMFTAEELTKHAGHGGNMTGLVWLVRRMRCVLCGGTDFEMSIRRKEVEARRWVAEEIIRPTF